VKKNSRITCREKEATRAGGVTDIGGPKSGLSQETEKGMQSWGGTHLMNTERIS